VQANVRFSLVVWCVYDKVNM